MLTLKRKRDEYMFKLGREKRHIRIRKIKTDRQTDKTEKER